MGYVTRALTVWLVIAYLSIRTIHCKSWTYDDPDNPKFKIKCIEELDECFSTAYPWYDYPRRASSLVPEDCENITYNLYTPHNPSESFVLNSSSIVKSPFNASWPTQIYIHPYWADQGSINRELVKKDALLSNYDYNVIVPDFRQHVQIPYFRSVANIRVIAARIAKFLKDLMEVTGIQPQSIHLLGLSLGCHTCGYIGKRIPNIGRITAISPAGRNFIGTAEETRLIPSDAMFVDVIQTSSNGENGVQELDLVSHCGHQNFFINNATRQPGCSLLGSDFSLVKFMKDFPETYCDHIRANTLWLESLQSKDCLFKAVKCKDYKEFSSGRCNAENSQVVVMGLHAKQVPGVGPEDSLYLDTGADPPYCNEDNVIPRARRNELHDPPPKWILNAV